MTDRSWTTITARAWDRAAATDDHRGHIHPVWRQLGDDGYEATGDRDAEQTIHLASRLLSDPPGDWRTLDVGCGDGRVLLALGRRGVGGNLLAGLVGLETSGGMLDRLVERADQQNLRVTPVETAPGAEWPPLPRFDLVVSFCVMIHLRSREKTATLRRIAAALRPGGAAVVQLPLYSQRTEPESWTGVGVWTMADLAAAAERAGLRPVEVVEHLEPFDPRAVGVSHHLPQLLQRG